MKKKTKGGTCEVGKKVSSPTLGNPEPSPLPSPSRLGTLVLVVWTHLAGLVIDQKDKQQGGQVEHSKDVLGHADVSALASGIVQAHKDIHKASWVPGR